jgi:hypothetical protein
MDNRWQFLQEDAGTLRDILEAANLDERTFSDWFGDQLEERGMKKNIVVRRSRLNQTFAYQIMAGMRQASRDKLIQLCFGMRLDETEASELLERGGSSALRPHDRRDVVIAFCLNRHLDISVCDDLLWGLGEATLAKEVSQTGNGPVATRKNSANS